MTTNCGGCPEKKICRISVSNLNIPLSIDLDHPYWSGPAGEIIPVDLENPPLGPNQLLGIRVTSRDQFGVVRTDESWEPNTGISIHGPRTIHIMFPGQQGSGQELFDVSTPTLGLYSLIVEVIRYRSGVTPEDNIWEAEVDTCIEVWEVASCPPVCEGG